MNRIAVLLTALGGILLVAMFYVLVFQPAREELAEVEDRIAVQEEQQRMLRAEIERLETVRQSAPDVEAELAAADAVVPRDTALPAALRQLQVAADEAGIVLSSISTARPAELPDPPEPGLSSIGLSLQVAGGYFQVVDFLRRVEDPSITSRGILWNTATVARSADAYPELQVTLAGNAFAVIPPPTLPEPEPEPDVADEETEDDEEGDA
ncbi:MAG: type II secretion system protein GspM [Nitriliruptoraceae bacterium]